MVLFVACVSTSNTARHPDNTKIPAAMQFMARKRTHVQCRKSRMSKPKSKVMYTSIGRLILQ
jgi:hypothetical protein